MRQPLLAKRYIASRDMLLFLVVFVRHLVFIRMRNNHKRHQQASSVLFNDESAQCRCVRVPRQWVATKVCSNLT